MNFFDAIQEGLEKAAQAEQAFDEVSDIFRKINEDLGSYKPGNGISLRKSVSVLMAATSAIQIFSDTQKEKEFLEADKLILTSESANGQKTSFEVAGWRQSVKGYPCIIQYEGEEVFCFSASELENAFKGLFSSASFGKKLKRLLKTSDNQEPPK